MNERTIPIHLLKEKVIGSTHCPKCKSKYPWLNLEPFMMHSKNLGNLNYKPLEKIGDERWICLKCFHIWIDSEFADSPKGREEEK